MSRARRTGAAAAGPPSTITTPPRDFGPGAPPTTYFMDPDIVIVDPAFGELSCRPTRRSSACGPARCGPKARRGRDRAAISCGATSPTIASCAGRKTTSASRCFESVEQQQRQHVRLPGPPDLVRAPDAARRPLRARRLDHDPRATASRASASIRRTTSPPIPTAAIGLPIRRTAASSTKGRWTRRADRPIAPAASIRVSASRRKPAA